MNTDNRGILSRSELLLGSEAMGRLAEAKVIVFGVGGVGSWCAECLIRTGIGHLTIVDSDVVCESNCNRQLMATTRTIGRPKVEVLRERLLEINPNAEVIALQEVYCKEDAEKFRLEQYSYVIDAIDSPKDKIDLILHATSVEGITLFSSMGAALRIDPTKIRVLDFWDVRGDTLAALLRKKMRKSGNLPARKFLCVCSEELPMENHGEMLADGDPNPFGKVRTNGSLAHITGIYGMTLAGLVIKDLYSQK